MRATRTVIPPDEGGPAAQDSHPSLEGMHSSVEVPHHAGRLLAAVAGLRRAGDSGQRRLHGPRQLGHRPARRRAVQVRAAVGGRPGQPDGHLHAGDFRPPGRGDRQGPGPVLPRLVSPVDPLAQLADERSGHRRLRPGGGAGQRRRPQPAVPHPAALGGHHHRAGRAAAAGLAAVWDAHHRGRRPAADRDHRRLLLHRDFRSAADPAQLSGDGAGAGFAALSSGGDVVCRHRHHRRDGDAAQPVPALGPGAEPQVAEGRTVHSARDPLQHHRLDRGPDHRVLRQRGDPGAGGDGVLRQGKRDRRRAGRWSSSAPTATGFASPT